MLNSTATLTDVKSVIKEGIRLVRNAQLDEAEKHLSEGLKHDFENNTIANFLKYLAFWKERFKKIQPHTIDQHSADYILSQWSTFEKFAHRIGQVNEQVTQSFRVYVYEHVQTLLQRQLETSGADETYLFPRIARCYKGLGQYQMALEWLHGANRHSDNPAASLAELGDCYALVQELRHAKLLLREAFFISAKDVDISVLESEMMHTLIKRLHENNIPDILLKEWLPIYAIIWGVFDIVREIRYDEYANLMQKVYALEREFSETQEETLGARLINCYMHLIDHYSRTNEMKTRIDETLLKIRSINPGIYKIYINR